MRTLFGWSRYLVIIAVVGLLLATLAVFVFGLIATVNTILLAFQEQAFNSEGARVLSVELIEMIDLFLLGTVLFITAVGLQELFVDPGLIEVIPRWMSVESLDELKFNLVAVIVVMLTILFLGSAASHELEEGTSFLNYGLSIAAVVLAAGIAVYLFARVHHMRGEGEELPPEIEVEELGEH